MHRGGLVGHSLRRSRLDRGHNSRRSTPGHGSVHIGTAAPGAVQHRRTGRSDGDERRHCCDIAPACVPSTVWSTAPKQNSPVGPGAVRTAHAAAPAPASPVMPGAPHHAGQTSLTRQASQDEGKDSGHALAICGVLWSGLRPFRRTPQMASAPARCIMPPQLPPDLRGFRPPSTGITRIAASRFAGPLPQGAALLPSAAPRASGGGIYSARSPRIVVPPT